MIDLQAANHTNRELELMLAGKKPLAIFCDDLSVFPNDVIFPESQFLPHVISGRFVQDSIVIEGDYIASLGRKAQLKCLFYALAGQAWRIPAMIQLIEIRNRTPAMWQSEGLERYESTLLGYTDEEVDAWCDHRFRKPPASA
ncbi:hypothetical protein [Viridibacterium curvum]|uniref:Uncharacterized protein n=1 Tax=Viridibacterium curvum TaxID=1101404 RepID=A0ABP9QJF0_9RHOO